MTEPIPNLHLYGGSLAVAPLLPIIKRDAELAHHDTVEDFRDTGPNPGIQVLAARVGVTDRQLRRWLSGETKRISLDLADRYLCATGRHLIDVYPWLYTPEQAAADLAAAGTPDIRKARRAKAERERRQRHKIARQATA